MKIKPVSLIPIFLLFLMVYLIIECLGFRYTQAKLLPLTVGSAVFVLAAVQLSRELRSKEAKKTARAKSQAEPRNLLLPLGLALGWMVSLLLGIYVAGFLIAIELFVLSYLKVHGRGWFMAICVATLLTATIYGIFEVGFKIELYRGIVFS